jgi:hypothetical protein
VRRTGWSVLEGVGAEVFRLGKSMAQLAGLNLFGGIETEVPSCRRTTRNRSP